MPGKEIDSISVSNLIWTQFKENRISFSFKGLPQSVHFTIAWNKKTGRMNLHITKNAGDGNDKPKFIIAYFDKTFLDELMSFALPLILNTIFKPVSFKKYSRKSRKNIKLIFLDDTENSPFQDSIKHEVETILDRNTETRRKQFKIREELTREFLPLAGSSEMRVLLESSIRNLTTRTFNSKSIRAGFVFIGKKLLPFVSANGKCYTVEGGKTLCELLVSFAKPDFAKALLDYIKEALERLPDAQSWTDTKPHNRPYQLYIEKAI